LHIKNSEFYITGKDIEMTSCMKTGILSAMLFMTITAVFASNIPYQIDKHAMEIRIFPDQKKAEITDTLTFSALQSLQQLSFMINKEATVTGVKYAGESLEYTLDKKSKLNFFLTEADSAFRDEYERAGELKIFPKKPLKTGQIEISYSFPAADSVDKAAFSREYIAYQVKGYIGNKGVFISPAYFWYPSLPDNLSRFDITVTTPDSLQILTQGKLMREQVIQNQRTSQWVADYPAGSVHLVGSRYIVKTVRYRDIDIYTYFFPESQELADSYLRACQRYLKMYEGIIGPYPFAKFAVVENFFPTGYGMPSYTLLGSQVIRLPFIIYTSLGHEITHNWWGNSVYINYETGNWCEGLTTYFADHYYKEQKDPGEAAQYRRDLDRDFTVYVKDNKDFPLNTFEERTESASRAIGYGKSAMVFHQLRKIIGDSLFYQTFRKFYLDFKFKEASWADIQQEAETVSNQKLDWFFNQWLTRKGAPDIELSSVKNEKGTISFTLRQKGNDLYRLLIPVQVSYGDSTLETKNVWLDKPEQSYHLKLAGKPLQLAVDPNYDVFRKLSRSEIPPTLAEIYAREKAIIVLPDKCTPARLEIYQNFARAFSEGEDGLSIISPGELSEKELQNSSLYLLGTPSENSLLEKIPWEEQKERQIVDHQLLMNGQPVPAADEVAVMVGRTPNEQQNVCIIAIGENGQTGRVANLLSHYGKYSYLLFSNGKNTVKDMYTMTNSPMVYRFK
jgi:aminopeptidase N